MDQMEELIKRIEHLETEVDVVEYYLKQREGLDDLRDLLERYEVTEWKKKQLEEEKTK